MNDPVPAPTTARAATERLFIAFTLPPAVRDMLAALAQPLRGVTWIRAAQLHLTLRFLGNVPGEKIDALLSHLATVQVASFLLPLEGIGGFPPNRPLRVAWVGVGAGHPRLFQLRQRLDDAVLAAGLQPDLRTFHPHVTLARAQEQAAGLAGWLHRHREYTGPLFRVEAFDLYASELRPAGAVHTLKKSFPLAK